MNTEHLCCQTDSITWLDRSVCEYLKCQLIIICNLTNTSIFNLNIYSLYRSEDRVNGDNIDRQVISLVLVGADITTSIDNRHLNVELAVRTTAKCSDHLIRVHDLDIGIYLNICCCNYAFAGSLDICCLNFIGVAVVFDC